VKTLDLFTRRSNDAIDYGLVAGLISLGLMGSFFVYSATRTRMLLAGYNPQYYFERQFGFVIFGILVMLVMARIDYHQLEVLATPLYAGCVIALMGVFVLGSSALGAQRWYNLGIIQIQPSEFTVLAIILAVATFCGRRVEGLRMYDVMRLLSMVLLPIGLIIVQPDLGTSLIILLALFGMMVIAGVPPRFMSFLTVAGILSVLGAVYFDVLRKYQVDRFVAFLNQKSSNSLMQPIIYQVANAKTAIGAGGLFGNGAFHGMQTNLGYVPEQSTDFIFTAVGEQFGLVGSSLLILLLAFVGWRMWVVGRSARDTMGRVLAIGAFIFFSFSCFENIGMTMGIMPVTGIPLPFISYGGSAVLVFYMAGGLVLSVSRKRVGL